MCALWTGVQTCALPIWRKKSAAAMPVRASASRTVSRSVSSALTISAARLARSWRRLASCAPKSAKPLPEPRTSSKSSSRSVIEHLLQPALIRSRTRSVVARRRNSLGRLLLKGMNHPDVIAQLQRIDDAIGIAALLDRQFADARTKPGEQLGDEIGRAHV